jgi:hypothetical protein
VADQPKNKTEAAGEAMKSCGCILMLLPLLAICLAFLFAVVSSAFH